MATNPHRFTEAREYQGWAIEYVHPPIPYRGADYAGTHPNYEPGHSGHVFGATVSEVMSEIDLWIEEQGPSTTFRSNAHE